MRRPPSVPLHPPTHPPAFATHPPSPPLPAPPSSRPPQLLRSFAKDLVFRKYLRYILNERPFDTDAVEDVLALRAACGLSDKEVAAVIKEVAERTFKARGGWAERGLGGGRAIPPAAAAPGAPLSLGLLPLRAGALA